MTKNNRTDSETYGVFNAISRHVKRFALPYAAIFALSNSLPVAASAEGNNGANSGNQPVPAAPANNGDNQPIMVRGFPVCSVVKDTSDAMYATSMIVKPGATIDQYLQAYADKEYGIKADHDIFLRDARSYLNSVGVNVNGSVDRECALPIIASVRPWNGYQSPKIVPQHGQSGSQSQSSSRPASGSQSGQQPAGTSGSGQDLEGRTNNVNTGNQPTGNQPNSPASPSGKYKDSAEYNDLKSKLLEGYVPKFSAAVHGTAATTESEVYDLLIQHGAKRGPNGEWINKKGVKLYVTESTYKAGDLSVHKLIQVKVGEGFSDAGQYVARIKEDEDKNVIDVNWGRLGVDLETKNATHSALWPIIPSYVSAAAGTGPVWAECGVKSAVGIAAIVAVSGGFSTPPPDKNKDNPPRGNDCDPGDPTCSK
jgi:hypothetical protein